MQKLNSFFITGYRCDIFQQEEIRSDTACYEMYLKKKKAITRGFLKNSYLA